jgi:hypothetical protein
MDRYIGVDVHRASTTFEVLSASGKKVRRDVVETNGGALVGYVKQLGGKRHVCVEEGEWSEWLYEIFLPHAEEVLWSIEGDGGRGRRATRSMRMRWRRR